MLFMVRFMKYMNLPIWDYYIGFILYMILIIIVINLWFGLGDNFFKSANYTIEVLCAGSFVDEKENLRVVEAQISSKRTEISKFESEYKQVIAQFTEMTNKYAQEMQTVSLIINFLF